MSATLRVVGEHRFDASHAELARRMAMLAAASDEQVALALDAVGELGRFHFAEEDGDLRVLGGDAHRCHLDEHAAVLASIAEVGALVSAGVGCDVARRLGRELAEWLPRHVAEMDVRLAQALFRGRTGGAVVALVRPAVREAMA